MFRMVQRPLRLRIQPMWKCCICIKHKSLRFSRKRIPKILLSEFLTSTKAVRSSAKAASFISLFYIWIPLMSGSLRSLISELRELWWIDKAGNTTWKFSVKRRTHLIKDCLKLKDFKVFIKSSSIVLTTSKMPGSSFNISILIFLNNVGLPTFDALWQNL